MSPAPATAAAPPSLAVISRAVERRIAALLDVEVERWQAVDGELVAPLAALRELVMAGGKRLRPAFCHWAFVGSGGSGDDPLIACAGAALELLHTFALVHDDVMDGSPTRRSTDAVHVRFERAHAGNGWRGESRRFGEGVAILVGDLAFVYADQLLAAAAPGARRVFCELRVEVNVGQYLDLVGGARGEVSEADARRIARFKSGKYTVERPLHLGAALAGRVDELAPSLSAFGLPLGEAFQLRDDLLGAFGDSAATGKPVGQDLREGKATVLYAIAARRARPRAARVLRRYGAPDLGDDEVRRIQEALAETGAADAVERSIAKLLTQALAALEQVPVSDEARDALRDLARYATTRDR